MIETCRHRRPRSQANGYLTALFLLGRIVWGAAVGMLLAALLVPLVVVFMLFLWGGGWPVHLGPFLENHRQRNVLFLLLAVLAILGVVAIAGVSPDSGPAFWWLLAGCYLLAFAAFGVWVEFTQGWSPQLTAEKSRKRRRATDAR